MTVGAAGVGEGYLRERGGGREGGRERRVWKNGSLVPRLSPVSIHCSDDLCTRGQIRRGC